MSNIVNDCRLAARLMEHDGMFETGQSILKDAADAIEALQAENREQALQILTALGQAQEAYEAQLKAEAERDRLKEALEATRGIVHKAQVSATMELLNMSDSNPIFAQVEAWRRRCVQSEQDIVAALGDDNG